MSEEVSGTEEHKPVAAIAPTESLERYSLDRAAAIRAIAQVREQNQDSFASEAELQAFIAENIQAVRQ